MKARDWHLYATSNTNCSLLAFVLYQRSLISLIFPTSPSYYLHAIKSKKAPNEQVCLQKQKLVDIKLLKYVLAQKPQLCMTTRKNDDQHTSILPRADRPELPYEIVLFQQKMGLGASGRFMIVRLCLLFFSKNVLAQNCPRSVWGPLGTIPDLLAPIFDPF